MAQLLARLNPTQLDSDLGISLRKSWALHHGDLAEAVRLDGLKPPTAGLAYVVSGWKCCANDWAGTSSAPASANNAARRGIECGRGDMRPPTAGTVVAAGTLPADAGHAEGSPKA